MNEQNPIKIGEVIQMLGAAMAIISAVWLIMLIVAASQPLNF